MDNDKLTYFLFFLLRDHISVGTLMEALEDAEETMLCTGIEVDTIVTDLILELAAQVAVRVRQ